MSHRSPLRGTVGVHRRGTVLKVTRGRKLGGKTRAGLRGVIRVGTLASWPRALLTQQRLQASYRVAAWATCS